jgi:hypothetical protein
MSKIPVNERGDASLFDTPLKSIGNIFDDCMRITSTAMEKIVSLTYSTDEYRLNFTEISGKLTTADSLMSLIEKNALVIKYDMLKFNTYIVEQDPGIIAKIDVKPVEIKNRRVRKSQKKDKLIKSKQSRSSPSLN